MTAPLDLSRRATRAALWLLVTAVALGVPGAGARVEALTSAAPAPASWTMMVYAVGDTDNVAEAMVRNLNLLTQVPDAPHVKIVALVDLPERSDRGAPSSQIRGVGEFTTAKLLQLEGGKWNELRDLGEQSLGRPDVLARFIDEAADRFPAEKYGLTLFDHGGGYQGGYIDIGPPSSKGMSIADIRAGMAAGMQAAGISRFELLYHASCLMSSYETVSALAPLARHMAGSEEIMISTPILPEGYALMAKDASGAEVGAALADGYGRFLEQLDAAQKDNTRALAAMSVVDGDRVRALDLALEAFARVARTHAAEVAPAVARARGTALEFVIGLDPEQPSWDLVDLGDFLRNLGSLPPDVEVARDSVYAALRSTITHQVTGQGTQQATGLNVFLPTNPRYVGTYLRDGTAPRGWGSFLESFLGSVSTAADGEADAQFTEQRPTLELLPEGARVTGQLRPGTGARAVTARTQVSADLAGFEDAIVVSTPGYLGAGGRDQVQGVWSYDAVVMSDGRNRVPMSAAFKAQAGGLVGSAYAQYTSPRGDRGDVVFRLLLDSSGRIRGVTASAIGQDGSAGAARLEAGGTLRPQLAVRSPNGVEMRVADAPITVGPNLSFGFAPLRSGLPFSIGLVVGDVGDQRDATFADGRVP
jgi:hypothetical protein